MTRMNSTNGETTHPVGGDLTEKTEITRGKASIEEDHENSMVKDSNGNPNGTELIKQPMQAL